MILCNFCLAGNIHWKCLKINRERVVKIIRGGISYEAYTGDALVETFPSAYDVNLDSHEEHWDVSAVESRNSHRVLLSRHDDFDTRLLGIVDEVNNFLLGISVVIGIVMFVNYFCTCPFKKSLETFRARDSAQCGDSSALEMLERQPFVPCVDVLQVHWLVSAFDYFSLPVVVPYEVLQVPHPVAAVGLGEEYVIRAADVLDRLPEQPPWKDIMVVKGKRGVNEKYV